MLMFGDFGNFGHTSMKERIWNKKENGDEKDTVCDAVLLLIGAPVFAKQNDAG